ncbi:MAG: hypothetical protein L0Y74_04140 [candidate division Zixibacteria bacterium]|nr:hypothetical protein [candidate division Zixibacteria bacterium]
MKLKIRALGVILAIAGAGGFFTVADDLRHKGELIWVASVLLAGLILLAVSFFLKTKNRVSAVSCASADS